jgi:SAM-dependent methyltransferase
MSRFYKVAYAVGFKPWEQSAKADAGRMEEFFRREEAERGGPGKALDIGCGSGVHTLALARNGWDVTGVDIIDKALSEARHRLSDARVNAMIVKADAATLPVDVVGDGFDFVLDVGCFHGLKHDQQDAMAHAVTARTKPDATLLMLAFGKPIGPPFMPTGATRDRIESAFAGWTVVDAVKPPTDVPGLPRMAKKADPTFYRLRGRAEKRGEGTGVATHHPRGADRLRLNVARQDNWGIPGGGS